MKQDMVNQAAFKVVKDDFVRMLNHNTDKIGASFGRPNVNFEELNTFLNEVNKTCESYSRAIEMILMKSEDFNEFMHMITLFIMEREHMKAMLTRSLERSGGMLGMLLGGDFDKMREQQQDPTAESMKSLDEFLRKMFRDMRGGKDV